MSYKKLTNIQLFRLIASLKRKFTSESMQKRTGSFIKHCLIRIYQQSKINKTNPTSCDTTCSITERKIT